jgi:hypothetical protein
MTADLVTTFTASFGIFAAFVIAGFVLLFSEIRRLETKIDGGFTALRNDLAEEFRAQRAEVSAQVTAIAAAINASRG